MKKILLALGVAVAATSSLPASAAEDIFDAATKAGKTICTQEVRTVASIRTFTVRYKDGSKADVPLPNYNVYTIPVDCETGKRMQQ